MTRVYFENFTDWQSVRGEFSPEYRRDERVPAEEPKHVFAVYETASYEGDAEVFYSEDGATFYSVSGSHCSSYGLERQWEPVKMSAGAIRRMATKGGQYGCLRDHCSVLTAWVDAVTNGKQA